MVGPLEEIDGELLERKPLGWRVAGSYPRTNATRFGDVRIRHRLYRNADGETGFALDEWMGWKCGQLVSPVIAELATWTGVSPTPTGLRTLWVWERWSPTATG